jgi:hypothetical protein
VGFDNIRQTVTFFRKHGIRYYGVVAVDSAAAGRKSADHGAATGAVLGIMSPPYCVPTVEAEDSAPGCPPRSRLGR